MSSAGPDVHPAPTDQRDPPASPTTTLLVVGVALMVVIVFALEVMHAQFLALEPPAKEVDASPGAMVLTEQVSYLQSGQVPSPPPPERPTAWKKGKTIDAAMDQIVAKYGKKGQ